MKFNFTQIPDKLKYPAHVKGQLSTMHSAVVTYVSANFQPTRRFKGRVIGVMNTLSLLVLKGDTIPDTWRAESPLDNIQIADDYTCQQELGTLYIACRDIEWDIKPALEEREVAPILIETIPEPTNSKRIISSKVPMPQLATDTEPSSCICPTSKTDLSIQPPVYPQFDYEKPWFSARADNTNFVIYTSLPEIPTKQNEISCTTDVDMLSDSDLMNLYPTCFVPTRKSPMYVQTAGLEFDTQLGLILPIQGFTSEDVRRNIIEYPHLYKLHRQIDGQLVPFQNNIEIDGELYATLDIWDQLPESASIPKKASFVTEYVIRRYLLERDVLHMEHKFPMFGSLDPFLTLFTTPEDYIGFGYSDTTQLARKCVISRVQYKQTRNPILRRFRDV